MNIFYALGILIVLFAGFNFLINAQPIDTETGTYITEYNQSESIDIISLKGLSAAFDISTGNDFIDSIITGLSVLLVIGLLLYARGLL